MTDTIKKSAPEIWEEIKKSKNILLTLHRGPDGDSLGSNLAFWHLLTNLGKNVTLIRGDSAIPSGTQAFPGHEAILPKNLTEIDLSQFDLFLILDCGNVEQISRLTKFAPPVSVKTIVIDHHKSNPSFGQFNLVKPSYPAVCQLIFDLFVSWKVKITPEIALCLFLGIYTDTFFHYPGTTNATFAAATKLTKINPTFVDAVNILENSRTAKELEFLGLVLSNIEEFFSGKVALTAISSEQLIKNGIPKDQASTAETATLLRSVEGREIGAVLIEKEQDVINISFRSATIDVSKIAGALGGGGHSGAAGATLSKPLQQAKNSVLQTLQQLYPELGKL